MLTVANTFYNKIQSPDFEVRRQAILEEVSTLITEHKSDVIEALNASGIRISGNASDKLVIEAVLKNAGSNQNLYTGLAYLIAQRNELLATEQEATFDVASIVGQGGGGIQGNSNSGSGILAGVQGGASGAQQGASGGIWGAIIGAVGGAVKGVFDFKAAKANAQTAEEQSRLEITKMVLGNKNATRNTVIMVGLGLLVVTLGVIIYMNRKK